MSFLQLDDLIYLDNAASTKPYPCVLEEMVEVAQKCYGNPSALHNLGVQAKDILEDARSCIAATINAEPDEIYFTSGATESNNWVGKIIRNRNYLYCSAMEHKSMSCVSNSSNSILANENGFVSSSDLIFVLNQRGETIVPPMVSVMYVNNEVGTIQPIKLLSEITHKYGGIFHTDATQAYTKIPIDVKEQKIDLLSASGHKIHGPRGVGFLYISREAKERLRLIPFLDGGGQEDGFRAGTENLPAIAGMALAAREGIATMKNDQKTMWELRKHFISQLKEIPDSRSNISGDEKNVVPSILNLHIKGVDAQELVVMVAEKGVCISSGSACNSGKSQPSHVLKTMGLSDKEASESIRISFSYETTKEEIDTAVKYIKETVNSLRLYT